MELLMDPSIWAGLLTLIVLEIVLGIDNLVFIAILADKLPPKQRDKARLIGLSLALVMRLAAVGHLLDGDADETTDYHRRFLLFRARSHHAARRDLLVV